MIRIFITLAVTALLALSGQLLLGLSIGDFSAAVSRYVAALDRSQVVDRSDNPAQRQQAADELQAAADAFAGPRRRMSLHFFLGVGSSLLAILVCSITVTYFVGVSRWCKEVAEAYKLDRGLIDDSQRLKRQAFPWAVCGMLTMVAIVFFGGGSDPTIDLNLGADARRSLFKQLHYWSALGGVAFLALSFWKQGEKIAANYAIVARVLAGVQRARAAKSLPVEQANAS